MKYLQRLRNEILHIESIPYLFNDLTLLSKFITTAKKFKNIYKYNNLRTILSFLNTQVISIYDILIYSIDYGRYKIIKKIYELGIFRYDVMYRAAYGHPLCMKIINKNKYYLIGNDEFSPDCAAHGHPKCLTLIHNWNKLIDDFTITIATQGHPKCLQLLYEWNIPIDNMYLTIAFKKAKPYPKCREILQKWRTRQN